MSSDLSIASVGVHEELTCSFVRMYGSYLHLDL